MWYMELATKILGSVPIGFNSTFVGYRWWLRYDKQSVGLNLFNNVLALFRAKFACNSAIRYSVFR